MFRRALGFGLVPALALATALVVAFGDDGTGREQVNAVRVREGTSVPIVSTVAPWKSPTPSPTRTPAPPAPAGPTSTPGRWVPSTPVTEATPGTEVSRAARFVVANTGGEGAVLRPEPGAKEFIRGWNDDTPVVQVGPDRELKGKMWKNVRDPDGNVGWIIGDFLAPAQP